MMGMRLKPFCCQTFVGACSRKLVVSDVTRQSTCAFFLKRHASSASSFTSLDSSDIELAYTTYPQDMETLDASKRPLIFLHGLFGAKGNLHSVAKHLASDGRKIVTFDARNHGDSGHDDKMDYYCMSDDLQDLTEELQLGQPIVLGHSMGGKTAMLSALSKPDSLSSLIVSDVTPNRSSVKQGDDLKMYAEAMKATKLRQDAGLSQARKSAQVQLARTVTDRGILSFLLTNIREFPGGNIKWRINLDPILKNFGDLTSFQDMTGTSFSKPTLFVFGAESYHYKVLDVGLVKQLFPSAEVEVIPDAGHFVHADKPLEFVRVVQEFLKTSKTDNTGKS